MKRIVAIILACLLSLSTLTACGGTATVVPEDNGTMLMRTSMPDIGGAQMTTLAAKMSLESGSNNFATPVQYLLTNTEDEGILCGEAELLQILKGATLLAAGGGGSYSLGVSILEEFKRQNEEVEIQFELFDVTQMDQNESTFSVAIMGSPTAHASAADLSKCALLAYNETEALANRFGKNPQYALALELGGANTLIPLLCAMKYNTKVLDADLCGRAVPGLETILSSINHLPTAPFALTDSNGNSYDFIMADPYDAAAVESSAVAILNHLETNGGVTGYYFSSEEIDTSVPVGTLTKCLQIGQCIELFESMTIEQRREYPLFDMLNEMNHEINCVTLTEKASPVIDFHQEPAGGGARDKGYYYLGEEGVAGKYFYVQFNNESMAVRITMSL